MLKRHSIISSLSKLKVNKGNAYELKTKLYTFQHCTVGKTYLLHYFTGLVSPMFGVKA